MARARERTIRRGEKEEVTDECSFVKREKEREGKRSASYHAMCLSTKTRTRNNFLPHASSLARLINLIKASENEFSFLNSPVTDFRSQLVVNIETGEREREIALTPFVCLTCSNDTISVLVLSFTNHRHHQVANTTTKPVRYRFLFYRVWKSDSL